MITYLSLSLLEYLSLNYLMKLLQIYLKNIKNKNKTVHSYHRTSHSGLRVDLTSITIITSLVTEIGQLQLNGMLKLSGV